MTSNKQNYKVLALKYRPQTLDELVGQDVLVQTLTNAINQNRLANAYMFTGVRGVGKTSTARIFAKSLNCSGADGKIESPVVKSCGVCDNCKSIELSNHIDVIEIDAASHTGVDDIRKVIEEVQYKPSVARYKIYIIDEVHMLSTSAFNALLKTLEEPPLHAKFIFATTEIRKVPITILSRCQKFNLARIEVEDLICLFKNILDKEGVKADDDALNVIARSAGGSARDGLSLLDQAIANSDGEITVEIAKNVLGISDRADLMNIFSGIMTGNASGALEVFNSVYKKGADPVLILTDLMQIVHNVIKVKIVPSSVDSLALSKDEKLEMKKFSEELEVSSLITLWQIFTKGFDELRDCDIEHQSVEMTLIKACFVSSQPALEKVLQQFKSGKFVGVNAVSDVTVLKNENKIGFDTGKTVAKKSDEDLDFSGSDCLENFSSFLKSKKEFLLADKVEEFFALEKNENKNGRQNITVCVKKGLDKKYINNIKSCIKEFGLDVNFSVSDNNTGVSINEIKNIMQDNQVEDLKKSDENVKGVFDVFKSAKIEKIEG